MKPTNPLALDTALPSGRPRFPGWDPFRERPRTARAPRQGTTLFRLSRTLAIAIPLALGAPGLAGAAPVSLTNGNSILRIEPTTQQGAFEWSVDGLNQLQ